MAQGLGAGKRRHPRNGANSWQFWSWRSCQQGASSLPWGLFLPTRVTDEIFNFLLVWYYCTLTIRESVLISNGSRYLEAQLVGMVSWGKREPKRNANPRVGKTMPDTVGVMSPTSQSASH